MSTGRVLRSEIRWHQPGYPPCGRTESFRAGLAGLVTGTQSNTNRCTPPNSVRAPNLSPRCRSKEAAPPCCLGLEAAACVTANESIRIYCFCRTFDKHPKKHFQNLLHRCKHHIWTRFSNKQHTPSTKTHVTLTIYKMVRIRTIQQN